MNGDVSGCPETIAARLRSLARALVPFLAIVALCLVSIGPWLRLQAVCSDDFAFHLYRVVQVEALLRRGVLFSRWAPDMALGYGYPFFNFYAPLSYYAPALLLLLRIPAQGALALSFALAMAGAGLAAFLWARDVLRSERAALVAAVAYAYAPYLGYDAYFRGNLAETAAWPLLPLALWAMGRLARRGIEPIAGRAWGRTVAPAIALAGSTYAAVLLTHNVFALLFSPLLVGYALVSALAHRSWAGRRRALIVCGSAVLLGLALAAFFWLPALAERGLVHSDRLLVPPVFVYWSNFIDLAELLALPRAIRPDLVNPSPPRGLGLLPVLLALPGLLAIWRAPRRAVRLQVGFCAVAALVMAWLATSSSRFVWDSVPLLEYVQFPWRLLGPAALCLALIAAAGVSLLPERWWATALVVVGVLVLLLGGLYWFVPRLCPMPGQRTVSGMRRFERLTHTVGTTAKGEYLPRTVVTMPEGPASGGLDLTGAPEGTTYHHITDRAVGADLTVLAPESFTAVYDAFHYPGWQVRVDGVVVESAPEDVLGRIRFSVPEGIHRVTLRFRETPLRRAANFVSWAGLTTVVLLLARSWFSDRRAVVVALDGVRCLIHRESGQGAAFWGVWLLLGLLVGLLVLLLLPRLTTPLWHRGLVDGALRDVDVPLNVEFEGGLTLLGYDRAPAIFAGDDCLRYDFYWTARQIPTARYQRVLVLLGPDGLRWNPKDSLAPRDARQPPRTESWAPGTYVRDSQCLETLPGTPPGEYRVELSVIESGSARTMRVLTEAGAPAAPAYDLGPVQVLRPEKPADIKDLSMQYRLNADLSGVTLLGINADRDEAVPGDPFLATVFWRVDGPLPSDWTLLMSPALVGADESAADLAVSPAGPGLPTSDWQPGDVWRGQYLMRLPASLASGSYTWRGCLAASGRCVDLPVRLDVSAPVRVFTLPPIDLPLTATFGNVVQLAGCEVSANSLAPGETLTITLVWQAQAEIDQSYHVFLHLTAPTGGVVAQSDGVPADWQRPTTGWMIGEVVSETRRLELPTDLAVDAYHLTVGLYHPTAGRLPLASGADALELQTVTVEE